MSNYEYKVVPAPRKAQRVKGIRGNDGRFAFNLTEMMNEQAEDGWEYYRAESLPIDEKSGLMGKTSEKYLALLVFRRAVTTVDFVEPEEEIEYVEPQEVYEEVIIETDEEVEHTPVLSPLHDDENLPETASLGPVSRD